MICERCMVAMVSGTSYQQKNGRSFARRYNECPQCKLRKYKQVSFHDVLLDRIKTEVDHEGRK